MRISDQQRRSLHLVLASARNKLAQLHQRFALERIAALPQEEPAAVLREYDRTHALGKAEAESLANRAMASFGGPRTSDSANPLLPPPAPPAPEGRVRRFIARVLRRRHPELSTWLSLHIAHTEAVLLGAHALHVIELLESVGGAISDMPSVVDFYIRETKTRGSLREPITVIALDRLYRRRAGEGATPKAANGRVSGGSPANVPNGGAHASTAAARAANGTSHPSSLAARTTNAAAHASVDAARLSSGALRASGAATRAFPR